MRVPRKTPLERVRAICMALPEATERLSHGAPTWFIAGKKTFVTFHDDHHGDGILGFWCAAPPGVQAELVDEEPERFYVPAYVGPPRLDRRAPRSQPRLDRGRGDHRRRVPHRRRPATSEAARRE